MTNLVLMRGTSPPDIPTMLRDIAAVIEAGEYGQAHGCAVVLDADSVEVFYTGTGEAAPNTHLLLACGQAKMVRAVLDEKA